MKINLRRIDHGDDTIDLVWKLGTIQYARTANAADVDTREKLITYILSQLVQGNDTEEREFDAHEVAGQWILDSFAADDAKDDFKNLPDWATWTGSEAANALKNAILSGMTKQQARDAIDAQFAGVSNLATAVAATVAVLKQLSDAIIDGRDVGHQNEAKAIMYLRDITIER